MVEVTYGDGEAEELPIDEVVRANREMLLNPTDFGLADNEAVTALFEMAESAREEREALRERVNRLEATIEMLATESDVLNGQCPDCGGVLKSEGGTFGGRRRVICSECDRELTPNGTMR
jgi:hypothetical protein